jgi:hypothetical protein
VAVLVCEPNRFFSIERKLFPKHFNQILLALQLVTSYYPKSPMGRRRGGGAALSDTRWRIGRRPARSFPQKDSNFRQPRYLIKNSVIRGGCLEIIKTFSGLCDHVRFMEHARAWPHFFDCSILFVVAWIKHGFRGHAMVYGRFGSGKSFFQIIR